MERINELISIISSEKYTICDLSEVCSISKGIQFNKVDMQESGTYPVVNGGINPSGYIENYNEEGNAITISQGGASAGYVNWQEDRFWAGAHCYVLRPKKNLDIRYLYHFIKMNEYKLQECQYGAGIPALAKSSVAGLRIPMPCWDTQRKIADMLDCFTQLLDSLKGELENRRIQYSYYSEAFYKTIQNANLVPLGDLCKIGDGLHSTPKYSDDGDFYFINGNNLNDGYIVLDEKTKKVDEEEYQKHKIELTTSTILMSINGTIGNIALYRGEPVILGKSAAYFIVDNEALNYEYLYYNLQSSIAYKYYMNNLTGSTIKNLGLKALREFKIPLPSLSVQEEIIKKIKVFDTICNDKESGIPGEIITRQKQYEYYRKHIFDMFIMKNE